MRVVAGQIARLSLHAKESGREEIPSLSVAVAQHYNSTAVWSLRIEPRFDKQAVARELGRVETIPPAGGAAPPSSVAAIASAPGAVGWFVQVERVRVERVGPAQNEDQSIDVDLSAFPDCCAPGVTPIVGAARLLTEVYSYQGGSLLAGNTNVVVPAGFQVQTINAWQSGTGGTIVVDGGDTVPLPPDGALQFAPRGTLIGALTVAFGTFPAGGGGYLIERTG